MRQGSTTVMILPLAKIPYDTKSFNTGLCKGKSPETWITFFHARNKLC